MLQLEQLCHLMFASELLVGDHLLKVAAAKVEGKREVMERGLFKCSNQKVLENKDVRGRGVVGMLHQFKCLLSCCICLLVCC